MISKSLKTVTLSLYLAVLAGAWDAWWHQVGGRESFWELPHLFLYAAIITALLISWLNYTRHKTTAWRNLGLALLLAPLSAPFDEIWHRVFGNENLTTPLVAWSPPHLLLVFSLMSASLLVFKMAERAEKGTEKTLFQCLMLASALWLLMFVVSPLHPTGFLQVFGFWGAGAVAAALSAILLAAKHYIPENGGAAFVAALFLILFNTSTHNGIGEVYITVHNHPTWLVIFSVVLPALAAEIVRGPQWLKGAVIGLLWGGVLFGFSSQFFPEAARYDMHSALTAILSATLGGALAGLLKFPAKTWASPYFSFGFREHIVN